MTGVRDRHLRALELPVVEAAQALVGCTITHGDTSGVIVETEAYHEIEPACHAFVGVTARTQPLFEAPGLAYVYRSYGIHALLNVVVEPAGVGAAVLIRALEPLAGVRRMRQRRGREPLTELCSGPGKLTQALGVGLELNATRLLAHPPGRSAGTTSQDFRPAVLGEPIELGPPPPGRAQPPVLVAGPRIGITRAVELPWRFCAAGSRHVSRPWPPGLLTAGA